MSILTASNPLILALVLSLYLVSKESYRILKVKKILICSMVGHFTLYPKYFSHFHISRKQHIIMTILRMHILGGHCYRFSKIEQKSENLHTIFNSLERRFACFKNKSLRYFHCLRAYYIIRTDLSIYV